MWNRLLVLIVATVSGGDEVDEFVDLPQELEPIDEVIDDDFVDIVSPISPISEASESLEDFVDITGRTSAYGLEADTSEELAKLLVDSIFSLPRTWTLRASITFGPWKGVSTQATPRKATNLTWHVFTHVLNILTAVSSILPSDL